MAAPHRAKATSIGADLYDKGNGDISTSFGTVWAEEGNEEFSLLSNVLSDLGFLVGKETDPSSMQMALKKQQQRCSDNMGKVLRTLT